MPLSDLSELKTCAVCDRPLSNREPAAFFELTEQYVHPGCVLSRRPETSVDTPRLWVWPGQPLRCTECGATAEDLARGWRALLGEEWEPERSLFVAPYCPSCYQDEFGESQGAAHFAE